MPNERLCILRGSKYTKKFEPACIFLLTDCNQVQKETFFSLKDRIDGKLPKQSALNEVPIIREGEIFVVAL